MALEQTGVELVAENAKAFTDAIGSAASALTGFESVGQASQRTFDAFGEIVTGVFRRVGEIAVDSLFRAADAIKDLALEAVNSNAEFERYETQFGVLLGSVELAKERLKELAEFGATTPFDLPEVVRADKILQSFGLHAEDTADKFGFAGDEIRRITGDIAAGTGARFEEIARYLGQFSAGQTGIVLARFEELGIVTRAQLREMGLEFNKAGALVTPVTDAFDIVLKAANDKFGGMMQKQSMTFEGMTSNLRDWFGQTLRTLGSPIFDIAKNKLGELLGFLGSAQVKDWIQSASEGIGNVIESVVNVADLLITGDFKGGIFGLQEDDAFIEFLFNLRDAIIATANWIQTVGIPTFFAFSSWFIDVGIPAIGGFISGVWIWLVDAYTKASDWINNVGIPAFNTLSDWFTNVALPAIQPVIDAVLNLWKAFTENDPEAFTTALSGLGDAFKGLWDDHIQPALAELWDKLVKWIEDEGWPKFQEAMSDAEEWRAAFIKWVDQVAPPFLESLGELIGRGTAWLLIEGIPALVGALVMGVLTLIGLSKPDVGKAGASFADGLISGFAEYEGWAKIGETIDQLKFIIIYGLQRASDAAVEIIRGIGLVIAATWQEAVNSLSGFVFDLTAPLQTSAINAINFLSGIGNWFRWTMAEVGRLIGVGLVEGFQNNLAWVYGVITQGVQGLVDTIRNMLGIGSPSKVMADLIGLPMSQGIAQGLMAGQGIVMQAAQATVNPAMSPMQYAGISNVSNVSSQSWNLNVNSNQQSQGIISDFSIMQAMA